MSLCKINNYIPIIVTNVKKNLCNRHCIFFIKAFIWDNQFLFRRVPPTHLFSIYFKIMLIVSRAPIVQTSWRAFILSEILVDRYLFFLTNFIFFWNLLNLKNNVELKWSSSVYCINLRDSIDNDLNHLWQRCGAGAVSRHILLEP